jgi:hypothetical protein
MIDLAFELMNILVLTKSEGAKHDFSAFQVSTL